jgi:hypothetical protein
MSDTEGNQAAGPVGQAPPSVNAGTRIVPLGFTIHVPDLRNGAAETIQQAAPKASIASTFKWVAIQNMPHNVAVDALEYLIRATYAQVLAAAAAAATDAQRADAKRKAIVLASIRAGAAAAYKLGPVDMNAMEATSSGYVYTPGANGVMGSVGRANGGGTAGGKYTLAVGMEALTATEIAASGVLVYLGMAVPVLQGVSLVSSGHHYLPTTKNIFAGMKRQALGLASEEARAYIDSMGEMFDDMAFHKACHPISPPQKRRWAKSGDIAMRLNLSGHGAAAVRLPALPSDAAVGKAGIALALAARPVLLGMGHTLSVEAGTGLIATLERAAEGAEERAAVDAVKAWAASHSSSLAFCAGIVQFVHESGSTGRNTLLSAYSVKKLISEHPTRVAEGSAYARVAAEKTREAMRDGKFADPAIRM